MSKEPSEVLNVTTFSLPSSTVWVGQGMASPPPGSSLGSQGPTPSPAGAGASGCVGVEALEVVSAAGGASTVGLVVAAGREAQGEGGQDEGKQARHGRAR
jgi:hypothetical protein